MTRPERPEPRWVDTAISNLLRTGVLVSVGIVLAGLAVTFVHHPSYAWSRDALARLTDPSGAFPQTLGDVWRGIAGRSGQALTMVGLLLLIATPVARVALSIVVFAVEKDRLYVVITSVVLLLLFASFVLGAAG